MAVVWGGGAVRHQAGAAHGQLAEARGLPGAVRVARAGFVRARSVWSGALDATGRGIGEAVIADAEPVFVREMFVRSAPIVVVVDTTRDDQSEDRPRREAS